jgi:hypothetical protein
MLFTKLAITNSITGQGAGNVQIVSQTIAGVLSQGWEWAGGPDAYDGGSWAWKTRSGGTPYMELTSTTDPNNPQVIGELYSTRWPAGTVPPAEPWFTSQWHEDTGLGYFDSSGVKQYFDWDVS